MSTDLTRARGKQIFLRQCSACHGDTGNADGIASYLLYPKPRAFARDRFKLVSTTNGVPTDEDLFRTITRGMPGSAMPGWGQLPETDRWALVDFVRELHYRGWVDKLTKELPEDERLSSEEAEAAAKERITPGPLIALSPEPAVTTASLAEGRKTYLVSCANCHGMDGRGTGTQAQVDDNGVPITPRDYTQGIFKGPNTAAEFFKRARTGIPGTPMPSFTKETLPDAELWKLAQYVKSLARPMADEKIVQVQQTLVARRVEKIPTDPRDPAWHETNSAFLGMMPLWWKADRVEGVLIRALHDGERLAILLSYEDPTSDSLALRPQDFTDGAAIELSGDPDPPFFGMGDATSPVNIWMWKASWEADLTGNQDVEAIYPAMAVDRYPSLKNPPVGAQVDHSKIGTTEHDPTFISAWGAGNLIADPKRGSSIENLIAKGLGTLTSLARPAQTVRGKGVWENNFWQIVFTRELKPPHEGDVSFALAKTVSIAFAVWDGSRKDRNGQKSVTIWHRLELEK